MERCYRDLFLSTLLYLISTCSFAYETETHAAITLQAYKNSVLVQSGDGSVVNRLGLDRLAPTAQFATYWRPVPRPNAYYMDGGETSGFQSGGGIGSSDQPEEFERCQMRELAVTKTLGALFADSVSADQSGAANDPILPIQNWLVRGAIREDDMGSVATTWWFTNETHCGLLWRETTQYQSLARSLNHFYDPYFNYGLKTKFESGKKSVDWALGYIDSFTAAPQVDSSRQNFYSYADARNYLWWALTRKNNNHGILAYDSDQDANAIDRMFLWNTLFRSLGDVLHLLEDTAQPQHTRNDIHARGASNLEQQSFEPYTNARILGGGSIGSYAQAFYGNAPANLSSPSLGSYGAVLFTTPARFFSTQANDSNQSVRTGLADYTNRGFFTGGTLPGMTTEPNPPAALDQGYAVQKVPCEQLQTIAQLKDTLCKHYTRAVTDSVRQYTDAIPAGYSLPPLASESVVTQIFNDLPATTSAQISVPTVALGLAELDTIGNLTIPRAVGYATGMLNYFFRGTLQVSAPASGIYAIVNHGTPHKVNNGVPYLVSNWTQVFGFTQVRLQVQNVTPPIQDPGKNTAVQQITGGAGAKLVAIAHYHRNECYQPDLAGDLSADATGKTYQPACTGLQVVRAAYPEISVSAPVSVALGVLDGQQPIEQLFDFSNDPVPINATDVFIQVAYRGQLGDETDGIAVGMVDVSEPTYQGDLAMTDVALQYQEDGSTWKWAAWDQPPWSTWTSPDTGQTVTHAPPDPAADLALTKVEICSGDTRIYYSDTAQLPSGHIVRIATLRDFVPRTTRAQVTYQGRFAQFSVIGSGSLKGSTRQAVMESGGAYTVNPLFWGRGVVGADSYSYITTCAVPYPNNSCPVAPQNPPSPWTAGLPNITPPAAGFVSENIGNVYLPVSGAASTCTLVGDGQPYLGPAEDTAIVMGRSVQGGE